MAKPASVVKIKILFIKRKFKTKYTIIIPSTIKTGTAFAFHFGKQRIYSIW
jgi:hypothetical protein